MENLGKISKHSDLNFSNIKKTGSAALIAAMVLSGINASKAGVLSGVTSQKQAIELLKSQGKLLPNVPTDYDEYGKSYPNYQMHISNIYPYGKWGRYEVNNLKNVDGKNMEIDNDVDSCNFLVESIYRANMDKIIPIIVDSQIDTTASHGEYDRVDWANSKPFGGISLVVGQGSTPNTFSHMNAMANVMIAKKDNYTEADGGRNGDDVIQKKRSAGVRPGKARLYVESLANGGESYSTQAFENIYNEAKNNPNKKYIVSYSLGGGTPSTNTQLSNLGTLTNVIVFVARNSKDLNNYNGSYAANPSTIEVGYVTMPEATIDNSTSDYKVHFVGDQKDWIVPMDSPQSGVMKGDGFCILGEYATSQSTAFMSAMVANLWTQNPSWTKDQVIAMLKRDAYKSSEYQDNANGWNEMTGYGVVQFGKTMKENIFPEIVGSKKSTDGKYYFTVSNWSGDYVVQGEGIAKDNNGYYVDLSKLNPGNHSYVFVGKCNYQGKDYNFPISRELTVVGLEKPIITGVSSHWKWLDASQQKVYFENLKGQITNYKTGLKVNLKFPNNVVIPNISVDAQGNFNLSNTLAYPLNYNFADGNIKMTVELVDAEGNKSATEVILNSDLPIVIVPEKPVITGISGNRKRINQDPSQQKVYFDVLKGQITNYKTGLKVNLIFNNSTIIANIPVDSQGKFDLTNLVNYPIAYKTGDGDIKLTIELVNSQGDKTSTDIMLTADLVTDVGDITFDGGFNSTKIYPNPVRDVLNIDLPFGFDNVSLRIFNSIGQLYSASNLSSDNNHIDLSSLKSGIYFVTIIDDKGNKKTEKIIKQ